MTRIMWTMLVVPLLLALGCLHHHLRRFSSTHHQVPMACMITDSLRLDECTTIPRLHITIVNHHTRWNTRQGMVAIWDIISISALRKEGG